MEHFHGSDSATSWELSSSGAHAGFLPFPLGSSAAEAEPGLWERVLGVELWAAHLLHWTKELAELSQDP